MNQATTDSFWVRYCADMTARDRRNLWRYLWILFAWAVCFVGSSWLIEVDLLSTGPMGWVVAVVPSLVAVFAVVAYGRYLRDADELQRAIQLQALALAVCAGFVVWPAVQLIERLGAPIGDWPSVPLLTMVVFYVIGVLLSRRRYQ